jgi:hypothetical protein
MKMALMRGKLKRFVLFGGVIGCCTGLLIFLSLPIVSSWIPALYRLVEIPGKIAEPLTELGIHLLCGQSPDIGCASGFGMLLFFVLWPLSFCVFWILIGGASGLALAISHHAWETLSQKKRLR